MNILIVYSSGYGTTRDIAFEIGKILSQHETLNVTLKPVDEIEHLGHYDFVMVGSSIRADKLLANTRDFLSRFHLELATKNVALFLVCLSAMTTEGQRKVYREYVPQITETYPDIKPISIKAFAGKIDFNRLNPVMKNLVKYVLLKLDIPSKHSVDARNWQQIQNWAEQIRERLVKESNLSLAEY
jgi:menaquinone-dependent protoporphyrinogen IX oxidase